MFVELSVENIAIIERTQITLGPGLTVLTGETGAGKSLLIDAIQLAIGERADTDLVRTGAGKATVTLGVDVSAHPRLQTLCDELGAETEDGLLIIQREVFAEGRSQARIGGKLAPVATLKRLGQELVDLHGQHEHQSLLHTERHIDFLDAWIGPSGVAIRAQVKVHFRSLSDLRTRLQMLQRNKRDLAQRVDLLRYQIDEIETVAPLADEMEGLESRLKRLSNAEKLRLAAEDALSRLADAESPALEGISEAVRRLEETAVLDPQLDPALQPLRDALYSLQEAIPEIRKYHELLEADPAELETVAARIDALRKLRRKYGEDEVAILEYLTAAQTELDALEDPEANEDELITRITASEANLAAACAELTQLRQVEGKRLSEAILGHLRDLAMDNATIALEIRPRAADENGADDVQFVFSANLGEPPKPLSKIASGGEISRVMLGIKCAMAGTESVPTIIFDEVDSGLGGRAAAAVARKLSQLAQHTQIIAISHLPQIASVANVQFRIEKQEIGDRVRTSVRELKDEERVEELARMIAGESISETAIVHARELLAEAKP